MRKIKNKNERRSKIPSEKNVRKRRRQKVKSKIAKKIKNIASMMLAAMLLVSVPVARVEAATQYGTEKESVEKLDVVVKDVSVEHASQNPNARTAIYNCLINVGCDSEGMHVDFMVHANGRASEIGIKDIKIQKKVWYGWKTVATSAGAEATNVTSFACSILYSGAEYGETYRISCVHYADVDGYTEVENEIDSFVFTY